jgi:hypothetical protein
MKARPTQLADLLHIEEHDAVIEEIRIIASLAFPRFEYGPFDRAYGDIARLFRGEYPGYRCSNVDYHDLSHTLSVTLAMARLMHGAIESGYPLTEKEFDIGLTCGLMHDTGYIQRSGDTEGTGAKYTLVHINRSVEFIVQYYRNDPLFQEEIPFFDSILQCTGLNTGSEKSNSRASPLSDWDRCWARRTCWDRWPIGITWRSCWIFIMNLLKPGLRPIQANWICWRKPGDSFR